MKAWVTIAPRRIPNADDRAQGYAVNEIFILLGIQTWKPIVTALMLPPLPLIVLMLIGARMMYWRRGVAWFVMLMSALLLYLSSTQAVGEWLERLLVPAGPPLQGERIAELKKLPKDKAAIVVLGGGRESFAPEYGVSNLSPQSLTRLHYGVWLSRQTGLPLMFSGGVGLGDTPGMAEAEAAQRIAAADYGVKLRWVEAESSDTRGNATHSVAMLRNAGVTDIVVVTHGWHMKRALRAFDNEAQRANAGMHVIGAPMGLAMASERTALSWMPSPHGFNRVRNVLREAMGLLLGA